MAVNVLMSNTNVWWGNPFIILCCIMFAALAFFVFLYVNNKKFTFALNSLQCGGQGKRYNFKLIFVAVFAFAAILRIIFSAGYFGHEDITYFRYWTNELLTSGFSYYDGLPANSYLPGYLYILYFIGIMSKALSIPIMSNSFIVLLKLPSVLCDCFCAYIIYRIAKKYVKKEFAFAFCLLYLFNPATFINSSFWGQADAFTAMFSILSLYYILEKKYYRAFIFLGIGISFKFQFIFIAPVAGIAIFLQVINYIRTKDIKKLLTVFSGMLICIATFVIICLPFIFKYIAAGDYLFIYNVYFSQVQSFDNFVLNSFNFYSMILTNWVQIPDKLILGFLSYDAFNYIIIAVISAAVIAAYIIGKNVKNIFVLSSFLIISIFTFSMKMHERYMFAALALLLAAAVISGDKRLFLSFTVFSLLHFLNVGVLLFREPRYFLAGGEDKFLIIFSNIWVFYFIFFAYAVFDIVILKRPAKAPVKTVYDPEKQKEIISNKIKEFDDIYEKKKEYREKTAIKKKDYIFMTLFAAIYFLINLINLGGTNIPGTYWEVAAKDGGAEYIVLEIPDNVICGEVWGYKGIDAYDSESNAVKVYAANTVSGEGYSSILNSYIGKKNVSNNGSKISAQMYKWFNLITLEQHYKYIAFSCGNKGVRINEIVLLEKDTRKIIDYTVLYTSVSGESTVASAFDEKETYPGYNSLMTDMYFDEIYHARTAFEHIKGWEPYEITHPPLGKIIISAGIRIFGMNPFGWRITGVVFASLLLPVIYLIGKNLFAKTKWAVILTLLMSLDGLHFVQGRIATIDTYVVFFSSLSILFMVYFFKTNILRDNKRKCLVPFALSGIFFGFAAASKWTGFYTGAGLLVLLIIYCVRILNEYRYVSAAIEYTDISNYYKYSKKLDNCLIDILITGIIFFVFIPFAIYLLSYLPYMTPAYARLNVSGETRPLLQVMLENQLYMYNYHSGLAASHQCESAWYSWLINFRSVYMYYADSSFANSYARIHSMGNFAISWFGVPALIYCLLYLPFRIPVIKALNVYNAAEKDNYLNLIKAGKKKERTEEFYAKKFKIRRIPPKLSIEDKNTLILIAVFFLSALLPWILVERSTFIYHFYPAIPYYIAMTVFLLIKICGRFDKVLFDIVLKSRRLTVTKGGLIAAIYVFAAFLMFVLLFPVFTGIPVNKDVAYVMFLWLRLFTDSVGF